jgi:hypothetical protein
VFSGRSEFHFLPFAVSEEVVEDIITLSYERREEIEKFACWFSLRKRPV